MEDVIHETQKRPWGKSPDQRAQGIKHPDGDSQSNTCTKRCHDHTPYFAGVAGIRSIIIFIMVCIISMRFSII